MFHVEPYGMDTHSKKIPQTCSIQHLQPSQKLTVLCFIHFLNIRGKKTGNRTGKVGVMGARGSWVKMQVVNSECTVPGNPDSAVNGSMQNNAKFICSQGITEQLVKFANVKQQTTMLAEKDSNATNFIFQ